MDLDCIEVSFEKKNVTERRLIMLPCKEKFLVERKATYSENNGIIRIDSIIGIKTTNLDGINMDYDSIFKNNTCLDSVVSVMAEKYHHRFGISIPESTCDIDEYKRGLIASLYHRTFLKINDTIRYNKHFPNFIINDNVAGIGISGCKVDSADIIKFIKECYESNN